MSNANIQPGTPQIPSGNTLIQPGGIPVPAESLVTADGVTIMGDGTVNDPLTTVASATSFEPARTLFVAQSWNAGADPAVFFTTIGDAVTAAEALSPTSGNPVAIAIAGGTYTENVTLPSWVFLAALSPSFVGVTINGTLTWTPVGSSAEAINVYNVVVTGAVTITTTGKSGGKTSALFNNCEVGGTHTGRASSGATQDFINFQGCTAQPSLWTFTSCAVEWLGGRLAPFTFDGACTFAIVGATTNPAASGAWSFNGTTVGRFAGCELLALAGSWASGTIGTYRCDGTGLVTSQLGAKVDVRETTIPYAGSGQVNRTITTFSFGPTAMGANAVSFTVPYQDATYGVALQATAIPGGTIPVVTYSVPLNTGFTLNDSIGGNTFGITVSHG